MVDALDECPEVDRTREVFLHELRNFSPNVHLLVTSRPNSTIERTFEGATCLDIYAHEDDVRRHLHNRIEMQALLLRHITADSSLRDTIVSTILDKTRGM